MTVNSIVSIYENWKPLRAHILWSLNFEMVLKLVLHLTLVLKSSLKWSKTHTPNVSGKMKGKQRLTELISSLSPCKVFNLTTAPTAPLTSISSPMWYFRMLASSLALPGNKMSTTQCTLLQLISKVLLYLLNKIEMVHYSEGSTL